MTDELNRWRKVDSLFEAALDQPPARRRAFLSDAQVDPGVRRRVEELLEAEKASAPFLERRPFLARALVDVLRQGPGSTEAESTDRDDDG